MVIQELYGHTDEIFSPVLAGWEDPALIQNIEGQPKAFCGRIGFEQIISEIAGFAGNINPP